jgi:hypothetical protein
MNGFTATAISAALLSSPLWGAVLAVRIKELCNTHQVNTYQQKRNPR